MLHIWKEQEKIEKVIYVTQFWLKNYLIFKVTIYGLFPCQYISHLTIHQKWHLVLKIIVGYHSFIHEPLISNYYIQVWPHLVCSRGSLVAQMVKNLSTMQADLGSIPGSGRYPGGGHGNPLQYSCLENPMVRGAWQAIVLGGLRVGQDWNNWDLTAYVSIDAKQF